MSECRCSDKPTKTVLLYACSGGANVAEIADRAARDLMAGCKGTMFCLAGLGADVPAMIQTARDADVNLVLDGCGMDCARKIFDRVGLTNYVHMKVTDLGIPKIKGTRASDAEVAQVVAKAQEILARQ